MIDFKILKQYNTDEISLRALFRTDESNPHLVKVFNRHVEKLESDRMATADLDGLKDESWKLSKKERDKEWKEFVEIKQGQQKAWIKRIQSRTDEGILWGLKNYKFFYAADMAWDGQPVMSEKIPIMLYAQGKLTDQQCVKELEKTAGAPSSYVVSDPETGEKHIELSRLHEASINVVRPLITRRVAAQANKYVQLYPFFNYESRSKTKLGSLRAAAVSERVEMISDLYGYRHDFLQVLRRSFLHTFCVSFIESAWDKEQQLRYDENGDLESYTVKEGLSFVHPHPTRVFYDQNYPLSSLNYDTGLSYCGFWDLRRKKDVFYNENFFNRETIKNSARWSSQYSSYKTYFDVYYPDEILKFVGDSDAASRLIRDNDREGNKGLLAAYEDDQSLFLTTYFEKVIPKEMGFGDYPHPVWVRLILANEDTVIFAEILPSRPGAVLEYNRDDNRILCASMAHDILPYQDQVDNLFSQMVYLMRLESFLLLSVDTDLVPEHIRTELKSFVAKGKFHSQAFLVEHSGGDVEQLHGKNPVREVPFQFQTSSLQAQIATTIQGISQILALLERNQLVSPQELGQFNQRVTSASEVMEVSNTTNAIHSFMSQGPDEYRAAIKQILYESLIGKGDDQVYVPIVDTFPDEIIKQAGFEPQERIESLDITSRLRKGVYITGSKKALVHDYVFNSRDGSERTMSAEIAKSLLNFLSSVVGNEIFVGAIGQKQLVDLLAESFRLMGTTLTLNFEENAQYVPPQKMLEQIAQQVQQNSQAVAQLMQIVGQAQELPGKVAEATQQQADAAQQVADAGAAVADTTEQQMKALLGGANPAA